MHVVNQLFREVEGRLDDQQKRLPAHTQLKSTSKLVFGTVPAQSGVEATVYIGGAGTSGSVHVSPAQGLDPGSVHLMWSGRVSAQNQVKIRVVNPTGSGIAVNTIPWNIVVVQ